MALKPIFSRFDWDLEEWVWGLSPTDFQKVVEGYACDRCLEEWELWVPVCPTCRKSTESFTLGEAPREWARQGA